MQLRMKNPSVNVPGVIEAMQAFSQAGSPQYGMARIATLGHTAAG